ncbi:hypothetical protein HN873_043930 [Arachis hypogaea]|nr:uncharacterized protein DS421_13g415580 [Arachis hypogaea]
MKFTVTLILISSLALSMTSGHEEIQKDPCVPAGREQLLEAINGFKCYKITSEACAVTEDVKCCNDCRTTYGPQAVGKCLSSQLHCVCVYPC